MSVSDETSGVRTMVFNLKLKIGNRKSVGLFAVVVALMMCGARAAAQQSARIHRIGILSTNSGSVFSARVEAFRQRLREHGYVEGKNIVIEYRYADGKRERLPDLAAELARLKVDVIVTTGGVAVLAAKKASPTIPIVFASSSDPVRSGLVSSLAQPGGTITGLSQMAPDLDGKRLELLKEAFPKIVRVAFLWQAGGIIRGNLELTDRMEAREAPRKAAAKVLGIKLQSLPVRSLGDLESAFARAKREGAQALITTTGALINTQRGRVLEFAAKNRLPAIYHYSEFVEAGGLMSYGPDNTDICRRAADFVDQILKGAKPADLPVQQATKFEFVINLKAAKQIELTIPPEALARADRVIK
jgi:putative ABC transport system substrate-binding protein